MPSLFRVTTTAHVLGKVWLDPQGNPCPADVPGAVFHERKKVAPGTPGAKKEKRRSKKWYGRVPGSPKAIPLSANKAVAIQMLAKLVNKAEREAQGLGDPFEEHRARPLAEHLADYERHLLAKGNGAKHARDTAARVNRILEGCKAVFIADLSMSAVQEFVATLMKKAKPLPELEPGKELFTKKEAARALDVKPHSIPPLVKRWKLVSQGNGKARRFPRATVEALRQRFNRASGAETVNHHIRAIRAFARWLVRDRRYDVNVMAGLDLLSTAGDVRRGRRPLSPLELVSLLQSVLESPRVFRGLAGVDRHYLYLTACGTGLRASELASLVPSSFDLDSDAPTATVGAGYTKNKQLAKQPLSKDVVASLRRYLPSRAGVIWPGGWSDNAAEMLQLDLEAVGIPYSVEGPDGPLYADFHALRHSYIALLDRSGATLKEAMQLARHSDPKLTAAIYGRAQLHDLAAAVEAMPSLRPETPKQSSEVLRKTGTDPVCTKFVQTFGGDCGQLREVDNPGDAETIDGISLKPLDLQGVEADCGSLMAIEGSAPSRTRTLNLVIKSQQNTGSNPLSDKTYDNSSEKFALRFAQESSKATSDPSLARLIEAWPSLSAADRAAIMAIVNEAP